MCVDLILRFVVNYYVFSTLLLVEINAGEGSI